MIKKDTLQINLYFFSMRLHTGSLTNRPYTYIHCKCRNKDSVMSRHFVVTIQATNRCHLTAIIDMVQTLNYCKINGNSRIIS